MKPLTGEAGADVSTYGQERDRLLKAFIELQDSVLCTSSEHVDPTPARATEICMDCAAGACAEHLLEHHDRCRRGDFTCTRR